MSAPGRRSCWPAVLICGLSLTGCAISPPATAARPPAPAPAPVVGVSMVDHRFELDRPVPAGRVVFQITNDGQSAHDLIMLPLAEDVPPIAEQLRGSERRLVQPYAGIYQRPPGDTGTFAVDLLPGQRYAMICVVVGEDGEPHWKKGMVVEFRTPGRAATS